MNRRTQCLAAMATVWLAGLCFAESGSRNDVPFEISLRADPTKLVPYEPVYAAVTIHNASVQEATFESWDLPSLRFHSSFEGGPWKLCGPSRLLATTIVGHNPMPPGSSRTLNAETLYYLFPGFEDSGCFVFARPGKYRLKAQINAGREVIESAPIPLEVVEPSVEDATAAKILVECGAQLLIHEQGVNKAVAEGLRRIVEECPSSKLADYAHHYLGLYYLYQSALDPETRGDPKLVALAKKHYASVSQRNQALRMSALVGQASVLGRFPGLSQKKEVEDLLHALEENAALAEQVGFAGPFEASRKRLQTQVGRFGEKRESD